MTSGEEGELRDLLERGGRGGGGPGGRPPPPAGLKIKASPWGELLEQTAAQPMEGSTHHIVLARPFLVPSIMGRKVSLGGWVHNTGTCIQQLTLNTIQDEGMNGGALIRDSAEMLLTPDANVAQALGRLGPYFSCHCQAGWRTVPDWVALDVLC